MKLFLVVFLAIFSCCFAQMPQIVAHRGAAYDAPENTLAAFKLAWQQGADVIEGDFRLTKDGEIVCMHDADTARVAGKKLVISQTTYAELQKLDVGSWKGSQWAGERIPTLSEVLKTIPAGKKFFLEVKSGTEIISHLVKTLVDSNIAHDQVAIIAFDVNILVGMKKYLPTIKTYWLTGFQKEGDAWRPTVEEIVQKLGDIKADGVDCNAHASIDAKFAQYLKNTGFGFHVWTVDNAETAKRFQHLGVDSITTNRPQWLRAQLGSKE